MPETKLKRLDPEISVWPPTLTGDAKAPLTGADWNALVDRIEAIEAALAGHSDLLASRAESR